MTLYKSTYTTIYCTSDYNSLLSFTVDFGRQGSRGSSATSSLTSSIPGGDAFQLPSYDDIAGGGKEEEEEEVVMDENERIALQEAEDERMARQLAGAGSGVSDAEVSE